MINFEMRKNIRKMYLQSRGTERPKPTEISRSLQESVIRGLNGEERHGKPMQNRLPELKKLTSRSCVHLLSCPFQSKTFFRV